MRDAARPGAAPGSASAAEARFAPGNRPSGTPLDHRAGDPDADSSAWSPATDTYIGPRDRFTHRIGSESERRHLLAHVERETALRRDLRRWQWVALGTAGVALFAFALAVFGLMAARQAERQACPEPAAHKRASSDLAGAGAPTDDAAGEATGAVRPAERAPDEDEAPLDESER